MLNWQFADYPGEVPVRVTKMVRDRLIRFEWPGGETNAETRVEIVFEALGEQSTLVTIRESGCKETQKDLDLSYGNCHGWTQMACCLKAFVEIRDQSEERLLLSAAPLRLFIARVPRQTAAMGTESSQPRYRRRQPQHLSHGSDLRAGP